MKEEKKTVFIPALMSLLLLTGACSSSSSRTAKDPAATLASACEAAKRHDVEAYKQTFAVEKLSNLQMLAAQSHIPTDDVLKQLMSNIHCTDRAETSAAHFEGETAMLDVKVAGSDEIERYRFVREGGEWKFAD